MVGLVAKGDIEFAAGFFVAASFDVEGGEIGVGGGGAGKGFPVGEGTGGVAGKCEGRGEVVAGGFEAAVEGEGGFEGGSGVGVALLEQEIVAKVVVEGGEGGG